MYHSKLFVVDGLWTSVGSANFDPRSFRLNDEVNINVYDADFASLVSEYFEKDLALSRLLTYKDWKGRPFFERATDRLCAIFNSQF